MNVPASRLRGFVFRATLVSGMILLASAVGSGDAAAKEPVDAAVVSAGRCADAAHERPASRQERDAMRELLLLALDYPQDPSANTFTIEGKGTYVQALVRGTFSAADLDALGVIVDAELPACEFVAAIPERQIHAFVDLPGLHLVTTLGRTWQLSD